MSSKSWVVRHFEPSIDSGLTARSVERWEGMKEWKLLYGLKAKSQVEWIVTGQGLVLIPIPKDTVKSSRGMLAGTRITTGTLLETRRGDKELEDKRSERVKRWPPSSGRFVLDSFTVTAFLRDEEGVDKVERVLKEEERGKTKLYMHLINLGEVY